MNQIQEIKIADILEPTERENQSVIWDWLDPSFASLAILGDSEASVRKDKVKDIANLIHNNDNKAVYWITDDDSDLLETNNVSNAIEVIEYEADLEPKLDPQQVFRKRRNIFPAIYFELITQGKLGFTYRDNTPPLSYRANVEGPTHGYARLFETIADSKQANVMKDALQATKSVVWHDTPSGKKFLIPKIGNSEEKASQLVLALWDFWAQICLCDDPQQFLLIIEPPKDMLRSNEHETELKNYIVKVLQTLQEISEEVTLSFILSLETYFPMAEMNMRTRIFLQTVDTDFDVYAEVNKPFFGDRIFNEWEAGNKEAAFLYDEFTQQSLVGTLRIDNSPIASEDDL